MSVTLNTIWVKCSDYLKIKVVVKYSRLAKIIMCSSSLHTLNKIRNVVHSSIYITATNDWRIQIFLKVIQVFYFQ